MTLHQTGTRVFEHPRRGRLHMLRTLAAIYAAWRQEPQQRLCQLIVNATEPPRSDPFFVEDHHLAQDMREYAAYIRELRR